MKPYYIQIKNNTNCLIDLIINHMKISYIQAKKLFFIGAIWDQNLKKRIKNPQTIIKETLITIYKPYYPVEPYVVKKEDIIYQNPDYCIVYKQPFSPSHPTPYSDAASLLYGLQEFFKKPVYPVNRLDFITGGLIFFALKKNCGKKLQSLFQNRKIKKWYFAKTGPLKINKKYLLIDTPIKQKYKVKTAKTIITALGATSRENYFLVKPQTGRTHQIRIHMAEAISPILGDKKYGGSSAEESGLFCIRYVYPDPKNGEKMKICYLPKEIDNWNWSKI